MAFERRRFIAVLVHILLCSFFSFLSGEVETDISCLKSIKDSMEDPNEFLDSWDFKDVSESYICDNFDHITCSQGKVSFIALGRMGLKGQFPRSIENCSSLYKLDLSHNDLSGYIPSNISSMLPSLYELDLSYNKFSGEIPASIANLTSLHILRLNNNEFTGEIPHLIGNLAHLTEFSVANNLLWGPVPVFSSDVDIGTRESYLNNNRLCGGPFESCDPFHQSLKDGLVAGYVLSATSFIAVYLWYFVPWIKLKKVRSKKFEQAGLYYSYIKRTRRKVQQKEEN